MEFRCRLASPSGQIIEGVYSADTEGRLRHELEETPLPDRPEKRRVQVSNNSVFLNLKGVRVDIFEFDGFLGDQVIVNGAFKPFFEVERRKYRFRILNGAVSRFFKIALSDSSPMFKPSAG